jgi:hypothetical protein
MASATAAPTVAATAAAACVSAAAAPPAAAAAHPTANRLWVRFSSSVPTTANLCRQAPTTLSHLSRRPRPSHNPPRRPSRRNLQSPSTSPRRTKRTLHLGQTSRRRRMPSHPRRSARRSRRAPLRVDRRGPIKSMRSSRISSPAVGMATAWIHSATSASCGACISHHRLPPCAPLVGFSVLARVCHRAAPQLLISSRHARET